MDYSYATPDEIRISTLTREVCTCPTYMYLIVCENGYCSVTSMEFFYQRHCKRLSYCSIIEWILLYTVHNKPLSYCSIADTSPD